MNTRNDRPSKIEHSKHKNSKALRAELKTLHAEREERKAVLNVVAADDARLVQQKKYQFFKTYQPQVSKAADFKSKEKKEENPKPCCCLVM